MYTNKNFKYIYKYRYFLILYYFLSVSHMSTGNHQETGLVTILSNVIYLYEIK